jgi:hypothetical protein
MTEEERVRATVKRERHVTAFAELRSANYALLKNTRQQKPGWLYECMTTIITSAFKIEAYLNHVGAALFPFWDQMERLPHSAKLNIIRSQLGIEIADGRRPYQTLTQLFLFRDALAHGRDEHLDPDEVTEVGTIEELRRKKPLTRWEELCTLDFAERAYADTEEIIKQIHLIAGLPEADLFRCGHFYTIKDVTELGSA